MVYTRIDVRTASDGVFDRVADHCVVLVMPDRLGRAVRQIHRDKPHSRVTLQVNPGPARKPDLVEQTSKADICHALAECFRACVARGLARVLVLEDDFFLGTPAEAAGAREAAEGIAEFLRGRPFDTYNLGRVAFLGWPCGLGSWRALAHGTAHGVVYSERFMLRYLRQHDADPRPIVRAGNDLWWNRLDMTHYVYEEPLVFQTFPATTNRAQWDDPLRAWVISALSLDEHHQPGYSLLSGACKALWAMAAALAAAAAALASEPRAPLPGKITCRG